MMPLSSSPTMRALTIGSFILGATLFGVGWYYSFANIAPRQELANAQKEAVREWPGKREDE